MTTRRKWDTAPVVFLTAKICPWPGCGGRKFIHVWSAANGDGSITQFQVCERCSRSTKFVVELPELGNPDDCTL